MTNGKRRRMYTLILALCLLLIVAIGWQMWNSLQQTRAIDYGARILTASPAEVCPGDKFTYPIDITIATVPAVSRITEGWCRADGICPLTLQNSPYYVNFVEPYEVAATATRTVPAGLTPGAWQLRHCNETHASGIVDVTCYAVNVTVKDCPAP